ncbi:hypothetical protein E7T09_17330 [Deinococcus sp. KSM4-11]|uniref:hypothetical protein n=1 Tax=Deinococcus sp. KSM4-11 TaxID=2568654 RepID=UPI0010A57B53|nr:hypothetical protein [Deinococcus sp. KSM4-11]THF85256.1 hypothetical protein E7T09_17330 [Deinococcus sp. KSM4-11]
MKQLFRTFVSLAFTAGLVACGGGTPPPIVDPPPSTLPGSGTAPEAEYLSGQLTGWPYTSTFVASRFVYSATYSDMTPALIPGSGTLHSKLPTIPLTRSMLDGCTLSSGFQGGAATYDLAAFQVFSTQGDLLGRIFEDAAPANTGFLHIYATSAGTLKGTASCTARGETLDLDASMQQGWNVLQGTVDAATQTVRIVNVPAGATVTLHFTKNDDHVLVVPVTSTPLTLKRGASVAVPVHIFQDGGISGRIHLSTNAGGLEVTPADIDLPDTVGKQAVTDASRVGAHLSSAALHAQKVDTTLTLTATDTAAAFDGDLNIQATRNGVDVGGGTLGHLVLTIPQLAFDVYTVVAPQTMTTTWPVQLYTQAYRGDVKVSVTDLPANLSVTPQTLSLTPNQSMTVTFSLKPGTTVPVGNYAVTVKGEQLADGYVITKRAVLAIMPPAIRMVEGTGVMAADASGNLWYSVGQGMVRQHPDGTYDAFSRTGFECSGLTAGDDGGIWDESSPQVRFDALTGTATVKTDPRGFSGCRGDDMYFDSKGRGWVWYFNIQRLEYATNTYSNVPGGDNDRLLDVDGTHVWGYTQAGGTTQLVSINADTLARQTLTLPGINTYLPAFGRSGKLWLPKSVPYRLAVYDPATAKVTSYDVVIDGVTVKEFEVVGVDATGRHWLEIAHVDGDLYYKEWVLYNPLTAQVVKRVPAIFLSGSGTLRSVSSDGTLWVRTADQPGYVPYAYVFKP